MLYSTLAVLQESDWGNVVLTLTQSPHSMVRAKALLVFALAISRCPAAIFNYSSALCGAVSQVRFAAFWRFIPLSGVLLPESSGDHRWRFMTAVIPFGEWLVFQ